MIPRRSLLWSLIGIGIAIAMAFIIKWVIFGIHAILTNI